MSGQYDQIGIACGCHPTFEQWCVVELGFGVESKIDKGIEGSVEAEYLSSGRNLQTSLL